MLVFITPPQEFSHVCFLFIKYYISDKVTCLSLRELNLIYWSSDGVVTFCLPDRALDTTDLVSSRHFRVQHTALFKTFSLSLSRCWERPSLLGITIWLLTLSSDTMFLTITNLPSSKQWSAGNLRYSHLKGEHWLQIKLL